MTGVQTCALPICWSYYWGPQGLEYASRSGGQAITQNFSTDPSGRILSMTYGSASYSGELYYHYDALGNTTLLTDAGGNPKASFIYDLHTGKIIDSWNPDNLVIINLEQGIGGNLGFELPEGIKVLVPPVKYRVKTDLEMWMETRHFRNADGTPLWGPYTEEPPPWLIEDMSGVSWWDAYDWIGLSHQVAHLFSYQNVAGSDECSTLFEEFRLLVVYLFTLFESRENAIASLGKNELVGRIWLDMHIIGLIETPDDKIVFQGDSRWIYDKWDLVNSWVPKPSWSFDDWLNALADAYYEAIIIQYDRMRSKCGEIRKKCVVPRNHWCYNGFDYF